MNFIIKPKKKPLNLISASVSRECFSYLLLLLKLLRIQVFISFLVIMYCVFFSIIIIVKTCKILVIIVNIF